MYLAREEHRSGKVYREIAPDRSQPGHYVRRRRSRAYLDQRFTEIRAKLAIMAVLARILDRRLDEEYAAACDRRDWGYCDLLLDLREGWGR